jgi:hypothetical protein
LLLNFIDVVGLHHFYLVDLGLRRDRSAVDPVSNLREGHMNFVTTAGGDMFNAAIAPAAKGAAAG